MARFPDCGFPLAPFPPGPRMGSLESHSEKKIMSLAQAEPNKSSDTDSWGTSCLSPPLGMVAGILYSASTGITLTVPPFSELKAALLALIAQDKAQKAPDAQQPA
jgi:hypothetical protein